MPLPRLPLMYTNIRRQLDLVKEGKGKKKKTKKEDKQESTPTAKWLCDMCDFEQPSDCVVSTAGGHTICKECKDQFVNKMCDCCKEAGGYEVVDEKENSPTTPHKENADTTSHSDDTTQPTSQ